MRLPVHIWVTERNAGAKEIAGYFAELARRLDETPRRACLVVESSVDFDFDIDPADGNCVVCSAGEEEHFSIRRRWLPEHPVPLKFGPGGAEGETPCEKPQRRRIVVLLLDPAKGNRFKVHPCRAFAVPHWAYAAFAGSAALAAVTFNPVAAVVSVVLFAMTVFARLFPREIAFLKERYWLFRCRVA